MARPWPGPVSSKKQGPQIAIEFCCVSNGLGVAPKHGPETKYNFLAETSPRGHRSQRCKLFCNDLQAVAEVLPWEKGRWWTRRASVSGTEQDGYKVLFWASRLLFVREWTAQKLRTPTLRERALATGNRPGDLLLWRRRSPSMTAVMHALCDPTPWRRHVPSPLEMDTSNGRTSEVSRAGHRVMFLPQILALSNLTVILLRLAARGICGARSHDLVVMSK